MNGSQHSGARLVGVRRLPAIAEVTGHAAVKAAAKDAVVFSSDLLGDSDVRSYRQLPLEVDPPEHGAYRAILMPIFARPAVAALEPVLRVVARRVVGEFVARGRAEAVRELALPMVGSSIAVAFGRPQDADELVSWGTESWETLPDGRRDGSRLERYLERVFAEADARPGHDAFSLVAGAELDGRRLTPEERHGLGNLILAAGRDTVIGLISGAVWHLASTPVARARLVADPSRIAGAVEELLRYLSPLQRIERVATEDVSGPWGSARAGDVVLLGFAAANHDPTAFTDPATIRLERSPNPHVAFGNGPHACVGVHLARTEARVFLEELMAAVPDWRLAGEPAIVWRTVEGSPVPVRFDRVPVEVGP